MSKKSLPIEAKVTYEVPDDVALIIGKIIVSYATLEHRIHSICCLLLQLNKAEARIALRTPGITDQLEMALDVFALKAIEPNIDADHTHALFQEAAMQRDKVAHGIWLEHPETQEVYLRHVRSMWPKSETRNEKVKRSIYPQATLYKKHEAQQALDAVLQAIEAAHTLGEQVDIALASFPERFRPPAPVLNPLGHRKRKRNAPSHGSSPR